MQRPHFVRWNLVCLEKKKGGLGVRNLALMNRALLSKWNWRYANEERLFGSKLSVRNMVWRRGIGALGP